eukprot:9487311-Pyramimonas_sp.AAC.3
MNCLLDAGGVGEEPAADAERGGGAASGLSGAPAGVQAGGAVRPDGGVAGGGGRALRHRGCVPRGDGGGGAVRALRALPGTARAVF